MPLPPVVIELGPADSASPHAAALVRACTEAVADGECRAGVPAEAGARAVVIVSWDPERRQARIEIGTTRAAGDRWVSRRLEFKASDPEPERWRAVGLVVGALVGEAEREADQEKPATPAPAKPAPSPAPAPPPSPPPATPPETPPATEPTRGATRLWLGVDAIAGPALDDGTWRLGAGAIAVYDVPGFPVLGSMAARYLARAADDRDVEARWLGVSLGVGLHYRPIPWLRLEGRGEAVLERIEASVGGARRDEAGRWYPGMRLVLGGGPTLGDWGVLVATAEVTGISQGTLITLENHAVGRAPPLTWALSLGARLRLF